MTWEEIIIQIRKDPTYKDLVEKAYFEEDLQLNVERFKVSEEFKETLLELKKFIPDFEGKKLLDLGAGNGIASVAFALNGFEVTAAEPDPSETIGNGAISKTERIYNTGKIHVTGSFGENLPFENEYFDVVYIRQAMHHANDLNNFIKQAARVLKKGGILFTVRDHVIYNEKDKQWFLESHPLHRFYGGENAFTFSQYNQSIKKAGLTVRKIFRHYDSVINYFPEKKGLIEEKRKKREDLITAAVSKKIPVFGKKIKVVRDLFAKRLEKKMGPALDESAIAGRNISFIAVKE